MPKASRRWRTSRRPISRSASGPRICAHSGWPGKPPSATTRRSRKPKSKRRKRSHDKVRSRPRRGASQQGHRPWQDDHDRSRCHHQGHARQYGAAEGIAAGTRGRGTAASCSGAQEGAREGKDGGREGPGAGRLAGRAAKRRTPDLESFDALSLLTRFLDANRTPATNQVRWHASLETLSTLRRRGPIDHRTRLGRGVIHLYLKHLELVLQRHAGLLGRFDGGMVRLEMAIHHQRVAVGRRLVGANDHAWRLLFQFEFRLLHQGLHVAASVYTIQRKKAGKIR